MGCTQSNYSENRILELIGNLAYSIQTYESNLHHPTPTFCHHDETWLQEVLSDTIQKLKKILSNQLRMRSRTLLEWERLINLLSNSAPRLFILYKQELHHISSTMDSRSAASSRQKEKASPMIVVEKVKRRSSSSSSTSSSSSYAKNTSCHPEEQHTLRNQQPPVKYFEELEDIRDHCQRCRTETEDTTKTTLTNPPPLPLPLPLPAIHCRSSSIDTTTSTIFPLPNLKSFYCNSNSQSQETLGDFGFFDEEEFANTLR